MRNVDKMNLFRVGCLRWRRVFNRLDRRFGFRLFLGMFLVRRVFVGVLFFVWDNVNKFLKVVL